MWLSSLQTQVSMRMWVWSLASLTGLRIPCCHELWCRSQMWLESCVAVAAAKASSCSSSLTPRLGTSTHCELGPKRTKKKKRKKERKKERERKGTQQKKFWMLEIRWVITHLTGSRTLSSKTDIGSSQQQPVKSQTPQRDQELVVSGTSGSGGKGKMKKNFFFPFLVAPWHMEFPGQESHLSHNCDLHCSCSNARSLTHWFAPGIEPAS